MPRPSTLTSLAIVLLIVSSLFAEEASPAKPLKSSTGAVFRSLAVPGWGQFYTENYWKAAGFFIIESSFIIGISRNHDLMMRFKTGDDFLSEKFHRNQRNKLIWWLAGFSLLSMGDSYVNAHMYKLDFSPSIESEDSNSSLVPGISATLHF